MKVGLCLIALVPASALQLNAGRRDALRTALALPSLALPMLPRSASAANLQQVLLDVAGFEVPGASGKPDEKPAEPTEAELLLQIRVQEAVDRQEKAAGFKLEPSDIEEVIEMVRNRYCGKEGIGFTLKDGSFGRC